MKSKWVTVPAWNDALTKYTVLDGLDLIAAVLWLSVANIPTLAIAETSSRPCYPLPPFTVKKLKEPFDEIKIRKIGVPEKNWATNQKDSVLRSLLPLQRSSSPVCPSKSKSKSKLESPNSFLTRLRLPRLRQVQLWVHFLKASLKSMEVKRWTWGQLVRIRAIEAKDNYYSLMQCFSIGGYRRPNPLVYRKARLSTLNNELVFLKTFNFFGSSSRVWTSSS